MTTQTATARVGQNSVLVIATGAIGPPGPAGGGVAEVVASTAIEVGGTATAPTVAVVTATNAETIAGTEIAKVVTPAGLEARVEHLRDNLVITEEPYIIQNGSANYTVGVGEVVGWFDEKGRFFLGKNLLANMEGNGHKQVPDFCYDPEGFRFFTRSMSLATVNDPCDINLRRFGGDAPYGAGAADGTVDDLTGLGKGALVGQVRMTPASTPWNGTPSSGAGGTPGGIADSTAWVMSGNCSEAPRHVTDDGQTSNAMAVTFNFAARNSHDFRETRLRIASTGCVQIGLGATAEGSTSNLIRVRAGAGTNNSQRITVTGTPTGGTFKVKFYEMPALDDGTATSYSVGYKTATIAFDADATAVQTALLAAINSVPGNVPGYTPATAWSALTNAEVTVTGGPLPGSAITIEFTGILAATAMYRMLATDKALTGGAAPNVSVARVGQAGVAHEKGMTLLSLKHTASNTGRYIHAENSAGTAQFRVDADGKGYFVGEVEIDGALNHDGTTAGFYGVTPVTRPTAYTQTFATADKTHAARTAVALTDNSGGTANTTVQALADGVTYANDVAAIRNNFADLTAEHNKLIVDLADTASLLNSVVDDLQALGLLQ